MTHKKVLNLQNKYSNKTYKTTELAKLKAKIISILSKALTKNKLKYKITAILAVLHRSN